MELPVVFVCSLVLVLCVYIQTAKCVTTENTCYCLSKELEDLRNPVHIETTTMDDKHVYFIAEQIGVINIYDPADARGTIKPYIDIKDKVICEELIQEERGLLGFALHPKFSENKKMYLYTIREVNKKEYAVISEVTDQDLETEKIILLIEQPGKTRNGGQLVFGDDNFLYIFVGDGGPDDDKDIKAQDGQSFLGKILRIDVDQTVVNANKLQNYAVPDDNPKKAGWEPEIYAIGMRNSWRCFEDIGDATGVGKGRIFCGELGSDVADEINLIQKGRNYGWNFKEGTHCVTSSSNCSSIEDEAEPVAEFVKNVTDITAVVGGPVYRGTMFPQLTGQVMFGDFATRELYSLQEGNTTSPFPRCDDIMCDCNQRQHDSDMLLSIGVTHDNEVILMVSKDLLPTAANGAIYRLRSPNKSGHVTCGASSIPSSGALYSFVVFLVFFKFLSS